MTHAELIHRLEVLRSYCVTTKVEAQYVDALFEVIEILEKLKPDPATGLVPCGCGGECEVEEFFIHDDNPYAVVCVVCDARSGWYATKEEAKKNWNLAMSGNLFQEEGSNDKRTKEMP